MDTTTTTVDMDLVTRWIEALESGEYQQGQGYLRSNDGFCCLGVVCDLVDPKRWTDDGHKDADLEGIQNWEGEDQILPTDVAAKVGLSQYGGIGDGSNWGYDELARENLTDLNDDGASFTDIAGLLREHYGLTKTEGGN